MKYLSILVTLFLFASCQEQLIEDISGQNNPRFPKPTVPNPPAKWDIDFSRESHSLHLHDTINDWFTAGDLIDGYNPVEQMMIEWNMFSENYNFFFDTVTLVSNRDHSSIDHYRLDPIEDPEDNSEMGIYNSTNWFPEFTSKTIAVTPFYFFRINPGQSNEYWQIVHADIILNSRDHTFSNDPNDSNNFYIKTIILHELGHVLGLYHSDVFGSIMFPTTDRSIGLDTPTSEDFDELAKLYPDDFGGSTPSISAISLPSTVDPTEHFGVFKLSESGICEHIVNGKVTQRHSIEL